MEQSLAEMEIDLKKMPLGNLSKKHIQSGYAVLTEIDGVLKGSLNERQKARSVLISFFFFFFFFFFFQIFSFFFPFFSFFKFFFRKLLELTKKFYTLIPHDLGTKDPTIFSNQEQLDVKMKLMEALMIFKIAPPF